MQTYNWNQLTKTDQEKTLARPILADQENIRTKTQDIIKQVITSGDQTLKELTKKFDGAQLAQLQVTENEFSEASKQVTVENKVAIEFAKKQIETNHQMQLPRTQTVKTCEGVFCERQARPIERVGLYIPGGSAPLVSAVLMQAVPAQIAGCQLQIVCTPPDATGIVNPHILFAAELCGIKEVYKVGGAQAIAAMAYGTETIPKVDKIFGPGNAWVTQAKMLVSQDPSGARIDMPAGPSEVLVIADENASPEFVAADLLSQAEHGIDSQVMLIVFSEVCAKKVSDAIITQLEKLPRKKIAEQALLNSRSIIANDVEQAIMISNRYAPEHLILQIANPERYTSFIQNAGAVFLGPWSPETVGDYVTGSNHVLPTYGYAKTFSGLSVTDFMKFINFQTVTKVGLEKIGPYAEKLAEIEGLEAHKQAVSLRLMR